MMILFLLIYAVQCSYAVQRYSAAIQAGSAVQLMWFSIHHTAEASTAATEVT
jgi:hypothetical protein